MNSRPIGESPPERGNVAITRSGWLMQAAFAVLTAGGLSLALAFALSGWGGVPIAITLVTFSGAMGIAGWFPTDPSAGEFTPTRAGDLHNQAARLVYRSAVLGALLGLAYMVLRVAPFQHADPLWVSSAVGVVVGYQLTNHGWRVMGPGTAQRIFLVALLAWLSLGALRLIGVGGG